MSDGEGTSAPRRRITPSADVGPVDPNADRCLQRRARTILRPRAPHIAPGLAFIGRIAIGAAGALQFISRLYTDRRAQRRTRAILGLRLPFAAAGFGLWCIRLRRRRGRTGHEQSDPSASRWVIPIFHSHYKSEERPVGESVC